MIAYLAGKVLIHQPNYLIIVVQGVGYKVMVPALLSEQYHVGNEVALYTFQYVRETSLELYGFAQPSDLEVFEQLITVSGVGPKSGLALLSQCSAEAVKQAIITNDVAVLKRVSGIGKKTAERLVLELKTKFASLPVSSSPALSTSSVGSDTLIALESLGYSSQEALRAVQDIDHTLSLSHQVKAALKILGQQR